MAPNVTLHFFASDDLNGSPLLEITDEDTFFKDFTFKPSFQALGGAELTLNRNVGFALFDDAALQPESFCRYLIHAYSDTVYYGGFFLDKRQQTVIHKDGSGAEEFHFGGPGPKYYLDRSVVGIDNQLGGDAHVDLVNGVWRWETTATAGRILNYLLLQDAARSNPALPDLTNTFDPNDDSNGDPWASDIADIGDYEIPIGESYLQAMWNLEDAGELYTVMDVGTVASPTMELQAYNGLGDDVTSNTFASNKVLLREGVNIANTSLELEGISLKKATHVIVEGKDGNWIVAVKPAFSSGDYIKWAKISHTRSSSHVILERAGLHWLRSQETAEQQMTVEILPGFDDSAGLYFPNPGDALWLGNTITVDTTLGVSHSPIDLNNEAALVTGFEIQLGVAGDDSSALKQARSWQPIKVLLNQVRGGQNKSPSQRTQGADQTKCCPHTHFPPECEPDPGDVLITDSDGTGWLGSLAGPDTDGFTGTWRSVGGSGGTSAPDDTDSVLPGNYSLILRLGGSEHKYTGHIWVEDSTAVNPQISILFPDHVRAPGGHGSVTAYAEAFEVPTGYDRIRYRHDSKMGGWRYQAEIYSIADPTDTGDCIPVGTGGDSDVAPRFDDPRFTNPDQHDTSHLIQPDAINNSGGTLTAGDVVVPDPTFDGFGVTTTTTPATTESMVGVVQEGGADGATIRVMWAGVRGFVNIDATPAAGDYLYTSTTAKAADVDGSRTSGAVGRVIAVDADDNSSYVLWWGVPDTTGGGVTDHGALSGLADDDHLQYLRTTLGERHAVSTVAASGSTETLDLATANFHDVTLTANCTLTLTGATNGAACYMAILLRQDGTGSRTVTWPGSVTWAGGSAPTLETAASAWNLIMLVSRDGGTVWFGDGGGTSGGSGAPTTADYLVGTAQGGLSAEIVVGTSPGGELGGTWASPTVDATHSGSAHHTESHASRHADAGADPVNVTGLDGFPGGTSDFLRADGSFANPGGGGGGATIGEGRPFASGALTAYVMPGMIFTGTAAGTLPLGTRYYTPIVIREEIDLVALVAECTLGAAAGREYRGGLYEADEIWTPGALVLEGAFNLATAGVKTIAAGPTTLAPGRYLVVHESGHATPTMRIFQGGAFFVASINNGVAAHMQVASTYGALPDPGLAWTALTTSNVGMQARVILQVNP